MSSVADYGIREIVEQARGGDTAAFARIVRQYQALVSGVLFSATGDFHKSEDFAQETFLIAWRKVGELRDDENLAAWLCAIARNLVHRSHRKNIVTTAPGSLNDEWPSSEEGPVAGLQRREQSEWVWSAIGEMDEKYRETLILYYRSGQSVREIAAAMELSEDAVNQRLVRARKSLKAKLERMIGNVLTDTAPGDAFTYGVMAAVTGGMILSTAQTAVAATTTTATGAGAVGKGLGFAGVGLITWLVGMIWIGFVSIVVPLVGLVGGFNAIVTQTRNAPTVRSRRLLIRDGMWRAGIAMFLMGCYFVVVAIPSHRLSLQTKGVWIVILASYFFANILWGVLFTNRNWRKIIEEDTSLRPAPAVPVEQSWLSLRALRWTFGASLLLLCLGLGGFMCFVWSLSLGFPSSMFRNLLFYGFLLLQLLPVGLFIHVYLRTIKMATEEGLEKYPPTIPDVLNIVLGKAEMPPEKTTLRARAGGDMIGMGTLIFAGSAQPVMLGLMQSNPWPGYLVIGVSVVGFLLFAWFVAGRQKVRHLGWMLTSGFFMGFYAWILWGGVFRDQFAALPPVELAVWFIYFLFFFAGAAAFCGYVGLFDKEINRKFGIPDPSDDEPPTP